MIRRWRWGYVGFLVLVLLAGCGPLVEVEQPHASTTMLLQEGDTLGQTISIYHAGLSGVDLFLQPALAGDGVLILRLHPGPYTNEVLARAILPLEHVTTPGFYRFAFERPLTLSGHDYALQLALEGNGQVQVGSAPGGTYTDGALYSNREPQDAQLAFRLAFARPALIWGLLVQAITGWLPVLAAGTVLYLLPGWALLTLLWRGNRRLSVVEQAALSAGLSVACFALLLFWTDLVGLHIGALYAWVPVASAGAALIWHHRSLRLTRILSTWRNRSRSDDARADIALLLVLLAIVASRWLAVERLDVPMWSDSYHHTMIARLIVENGGLFHNWSPYAELQSFTYHFGFHSAVAVFHWFTGVPLHQSVIHVGQLCNVFAVLVTYPLAVRLGGSRWAGVMAVLLAGLLSHMPMYYLNWGRYTQLAGQVILPCLVFLAWRFLEVPRHDWRLLALVWVAMSGLALTHYRILLFAGVFFPAFLVTVEWKRETWYRLVGRMLWIVGVAGLLVAPWFVRMFSGRILKIVGDIVAVSAGPDAAQAVAVNQIGNLFDYLPAVFWLLLPWSVCWGCWRRERAMITMVIWWFFCMLLVNPHWLGLPGAGTITNFTLAIALYLPASILLGAAASWMLQSVQEHSSAVLQVLLIGLVSLAGLVSRTDDVNLRAHELVTRADMRAMAWIEDNTPPDARFLVNAFFDPYGNATGADAGWWLPLLAGRQTMLPPMIYFSEQWSSPDYGVQVHTLVNAVVSNGVDHPQTQQLLHEHGITHVYIGQRREDIWMAAPYVLPPERLFASPLMRPIYHEDRVWVFEMVSEHGMQ